jgi:secreted trypsin-like serine protease
MNKQIKFIFSGVAASFLTMVSPGCRDAKTSEIKVIGGKTADYRPFMVKLVQNGDPSAPSCGGSLIAKNVVLTAAHCVVNMDRRIQVSMGYHHVSEHRKDTLVNVEAVKVHELYDESKSLQNDIALLILADYDNQVFDKQVVPIPMSKDLLKPEHVGSATVIGYGNASSVGNLFVDHLQEVTVPVIPAPLCKTAEGYGEINDSQICAGSLSGGIDSCQGDSGGPLVIKNAEGKEELVGVVSWGFGCAQKTAPGVYTRVASYSEWIRRHSETLIKSQKMVDAKLATEIFTSYFYDGISEFSQKKTDNGFFNVKKSYSLPEDSQFNPLILNDKSLQPGALVERVIWKRVFTAESVESGAVHAIFFTDRRTQSKFTANANIVKVLSSSCTFNQSTFFLNAKDKQVFLTVDEKTFFGMADENILTAELEPTSRCAIENVELTYYFKQEQDGSTKSILRIVAPDESIDLTYLLEPISLETSPKFQAKFILAAEKSGTAFLYNGDNDEVFSWELSCNFDMTILLGHIEIQSVKIGDWYSWKVLHPEHLIGKIKSKQSISFGYVNSTFQDIGYEPKCRLNGLLVSINIEKTPDELQQ